MKNFLKYFYNISVDKIDFNKKYYKFTYNDYEYKLYIITENININFLIQLNSKLLGHTLISQIVANINKEYISFYNGIRYVLIKLFVNNKNITLEEICQFDNSLYTNNISVNWGNLWSKKVDYLEDLVSENGKKYPVIVDSFNYFVGMAENAISYYNKIIIPKGVNYYISHKSIRLGDSIDVIYDPLNIIFDYRARDIAEYIKISFFLKNKNVIYEIEKLINTNYLSLVDVKLIVSRILYPSFYFDFYEDILVYNEDEKILVNIINMLPEYESYLYSVISLFQKYYDIDSVDWLK